MVFYIVIFHKLIFTILKRIFNINVEILYIEVIRGG